MLDDPCCKEHKRSRFEGKPTRNFKTKPQYSTCAAVVMLSRASFDVVGIAQSTMTTDCGAGDTAHVDNVAPMEPIRRSSDNHSTFCQGALICL